MNFPIYRRLKNGKSYYRISSMEHMTELQQLGNKWLVHELYAKILPERLLISDILQNEGSQFEECESIEFDQRLESTT